jgi:hypothetical protein
VSKFMLLYISPLSAEQQMANASPEETQKGMEPWMAWFGKMGSAIVDGGAPLVAGANVTASGSSGRKTQIAGYSIIEAADLNAAKGMLAGHPHLMDPGNSIEVVETMPMPGM